MDDESLVVPEETIDRYATDKMRVLLGPFCGEIGWELCYWQAHGRWLRDQFSKEQYEFVVVTFAGRQALYRDYADLIVFHTSRRVREFGKLNCYNGDDFKRYDYFKYMEKMSNKYHAYFCASVPNYNGRYHIPAECQTFKQFKPLRTEWVQHFSPTVEAKSPAVMLFPRHKNDERDWGEANWIELVDLLVKHGYTVVLAGVKSHSCCAYYKENERVINLIQYGADVMHTLDMTLYYLDRVNYAIGSQSFLPLLSMHQGVPTMMWGAERERHEEELNHFGTKCTFIEDPLYQVSVEEVLERFEGKI